MILVSTILCASVLSAVDGVSADGLLPRPQSMTRSEGSFAVPRAFEGLLQAPAGRDIQRLRARLAEALEGLGLDGRVEQAPPSSRDYLLTVGEPGRRERGTDSLPAEGYLLDVTPSGLRILAPEEHGLFYGMMTLAQLIENGSGTLPCVHIRDWPAIALRGPHEDFGRNQLPTMDDLKRSIRTAARYKMNTYCWFIEPDHFVYDFDPEISVDYDRFSFDEIRELVTYAREYYVDTVSYTHLTLPTN